MDVSGHASGRERAAREEAVGEPITVHVLTAHPLYRQSGRASERAGSGPLPALSALRPVMDGPARLARVPRADGGTAWPSAELQAKGERAESRGSFILRLAKADSMTSVTEHKAGTMRFKSRLRGRIEWR